MLKDVNVPLRRNFINALMMGPAPALRVADGVYENSGFNLNHDLKESGLSISMFPFSDKRREIWRSLDSLADDRRAAALDEMDALPNDYGVCDNWEQITERWPEILSDPRHFVIGLQRLDRSTEPEQGGWRWHKWGEYIGTQDPQMEYLHDEPEIETVYVFHIYEIKE